MTRKHFERLALILGSIADASDRKRATGLAVEWCRSTNPNFNAARFRAAVASAAARDGWAKAAE